MISGNIWWSAKYRQCEKLALRLLQPLWCFSFNDVGTPLSYRTSRDRGAQQSSYNIWRRFVHPVMQVVTHETLFRNSKQNQRGILNVTTWSVLSLWFDPIYSLDEKKKKSFEKKTRVNLQCEPPLWPTSDCSNDCSASGLLFYLLLVKRIMVRLG